MSYVLRSCASKTARLVLPYYLTTAQCVKYNQMYVSLLYSTFYIELYQLVKTPITIKHLIAKQVEFCSEAVYWSDAKYHIAS